MKIKVSQLYEADIESLRSKMADSFAAHNRENENLRALIRSLREKLAN